MKKNWKLFTFYRNFIHILFPTPTQGINPKNIKIQTNDRLLELQTSGKEETKKLTRKRHRFTIDLQHPQECFRSIVNQWQRKSYTYFVTSGSHWTVRLGHSRACVITKSYRNGVFFFQILYSSFMIRSSTASSKGSLQYNKTNIK